MRRYIGSYQNAPLISRARAGHFTVPRLVGKMKGRSKAALTSAKEFNSWIRGGVGSLREGRDLIDICLACAEQHKSAPMGWVPSTVPALREDQGTREARSLPNCLPRVPVKGIGVAQRSFPCSLHRARQPPLPRLGGKLRGLGDQARGVECDHKRDIKIP